MKHRRRRIARHRRAIHKRISQVRQAGYIVTVPAGYMPPLVGESAIMVTPGWASHRRGAL